MEENMFKFRFYVPEKETAAADGEKSVTFTKQEHTLEGLMAGEGPAAYQEAAQYLGLKDFLKSEIYEGDILELCVTKELMDTPFAGSNLGKILKAEPYVRSAVLFFHHGERARSCAYDVYFMEDGMGVRRYSDGDVKPICYDEGSLFPKYLIEKGARIVANIIDDPSALYHMDRHTLWAQVPALQSEYESRHGKDGYHGMPKKDTKE